MGALSYADDITLIAPNIGGLNEMLKLCNNYATVYNDYDYDYEIILFRHKQNK